jgi:uncharacterized membrane protein YfcA
MCAGGDVTDTATEAAVVEPTRGPAPVDAIDDATLPPFRPGPQPTKTSLRNWGLAGIGWAILVAATYAGFHGHLNPYLSLTGLLVGFMVGLTGMGGGALMTPILIFVFGFSPTMAIGTDVTYAAVTKIFGSWRHWRNGSVDLPLALFLACGSVPAALVGVATVQVVKNHYGDTVNSILYRAIGAALMAVGVLLIVKLVMKVDRQHRRENITMSLRVKLLTVLLGASAGFIIGLTSVGSGTFLGVFLILFYPLTTDRIVGTDIFHAMILLLATGIAQISVGNVDLWMVAALLMGSIPGVLIGSQLTVKAPHRVLRVCLAVVLFLSGLSLLGKA